MAVFITTDELKELQDYAAEIGASTVGHAVYQITRRFLKRRRE
ncbi:MAG: hypothetical protein QNK04_18265 [Myxococcota bacterium]|nr:hypothetical protein [Myxococcota bacterium]